MDFYINNKSSKDYSCRLLASWSVSGQKITRSFLKGTDNTAFSVFGTSYGLKTIELPIHIFGSNARDAERKRSFLTAAFSNSIVELFLPDGFLYRCALTKIGDKEEITIDGAIIETEYTFDGIQCDPLIIIESVNGEVLIEGTEDYMDCRLTVTVSKDADTYKMAGITWGDVKSGDVLVVDGLEKRFLKNGANATLENDATTWPKLTAGMNMLYCPDPMTLEYYPVYK